MTYQLLKMLHVAAVVAWLGGSLFVSLFLLSSQPPDSDEAPKERKMLGALRRWTLFVTTPAMVLAWLVGLHLAVTFGWFAMTWIWIKIALALSVLGHFIVAMRTRGHGERIARRFQRIHVSVFCHMLGIVLLAKGMFYFGA